MTIQHTLRKIRYLFRYSGMKLHEKRAPEMNPIRYRAAFVFNIIWFNFASLGSCVFLVIGLVNGKSFTELSFVAPCTSFSLLGTAKAVNYTMYDTEAYQLIEDLIKLDASRKDSDNSEKVKQIKDNEINFIRNVLNVLNVMYVLLISLYNVGPLVGTAVVYYRTRELRFFLPFLDIYPFDALSLKYWPYAYIHQNWAVFLVLFYVGSVDCFLIICCTYIRIQFRLVQLDIENIIPARNIISGQVRNDIEFQSKLKEILFRHQNIIRLSNYLNKLNSKSMLINVISSSITICLTGFNVMVNKDLTLVMPSLVFFITSLLQGLYLCYFGDLLMNSSEEVSDAVYASRWYLADKEITKKLIFVMTRGQMPCKLSASGFMDMNLRAFMKIIGTSWTYFAALKTTYDR